MEIAMQKLKGFIVMVGIILVGCTSLAAQQKQSKPTQPFSIEEFFNFDHFFKDFEAQMKANEEVWIQLFDPKLMDSTFQQLQQFNFGGSADSMMQQFNFQLEGSDEMGLGNFLEQIFKEFDMNNNFFSTPPAAPSIPPNDPKEPNKVPPTPPNAPEQPIKIKPAENTVIRI
jgi:hypothetical protein